MKANAQYNDFVGTSAADISDFGNLNDFLKKRNVDTDRYNAVGASFYGGQNNFFTASIICVDNELSSSDKKHVVKLFFETGITQSEFFGLFKRFSVQVVNKYGGYSELEIEDEITIDDTNNK